MAGVFKPQGLRRVNDRNKLALFVPVDHIKLVNAPLLVVVKFRLVNALSVFAYDHYVVVALVLLLAQRLVL